MAGMMYVVMDGVEYKVRVRADSPLTESFELRDGPNAMTMLDGSERRDLLGTYYSHTLYVEPDPAHPEAYDDFFQAISAPVDAHEIVMPHGQGTMTYRAKITGGSHNLRGTLGGRRWFYGLQVGFEPMAPQREAE